jgi:hypothetical protein
MINLMPEIIASIFALVTLGTATTLYFKKFRRSSKPSPQPLTLDTIPESSYRALNDAIKKAQNILAKAELEALNLVSATKHNTAELEQQYAQEFASSATQMETAFSQEITAAEKAYLQYLEGLKAHGDQAENLLLSTTQQRTNELFERFEQNLSTFLTQTQQQSLSAVDLEMRAARQLIETYKAQQLKLIDENIIAMLEKTLSLVLVQKITLKDEMDLVYEALEKAKAENFIV